MNVTLYRTALCPRCRNAERILRRVMLEYPDPELGIIDVAAHPIESFRAGVRMIPALKCGDEILSAVFLDETRIRTFLQRHHAKRNKNYEA